jgi:CheY-like chemotaxis protein
MSRRHVGLIVEDDRDLRDDLVGRLDALGYDVVKAETLEEGLEKVRTGGFCFALVDLQIKRNADAGRAYPECGLALVEGIRKRFPGRNGDDHHLVQVLIMSGYGKEPDFIRRGFDAGADDVLRKPLEENRPGLEAVIERCLTRSGRTKHATCSRQDQTAKRGVERRADGASPGSVKLEISGERRRRRFEASVNGNAVLLQPNSLYMLLELAAVRVKRAEGWLETKTFGPDVALVHRSLSRLSKDAGDLPGGLELLENDGAGSYRLNPRVTLEVGAWDLLEGHHDARVRKLVALLRGESR